MAFDLTCTGLGRKLFYDEKEPLREYARGLLGQFPCMRMEQAAGRDELIRRYADSVDGVIYHTETVQGDLWHILLRRCV